MRSLLLPLALVFTTALALAQQPPPPGGGGGGRRAPQPPKNLKVLEPANLIGVMRGYTTSLGVQCSHCHVQGDFASDDNPKKEIARKMIALVKDINGNANMVTGKTVSCFTCHRGAVDPVSAIPAPPPPPQRPPQP